MNAETTTDEQEARMLAGCHNCQLDELEGHELACRDCLEYWLKFVRGTVEGAREMKVLIACEESQTVCKAFRARGHEAYSCDIQEPSGGHPEWHILGDALKAIDGGASDHHGWAGA